jgi:hypothetical protein
MSNVGESSLRSHICLGPDAVIPLSSCQILFPYENQKKINLAPMRSNM